MEQLSLDVNYQRACTKAKELGVRPLIAKLFLHQSEPKQGVLRRFDPSCWLETDVDTGLLKVLPDCSNHDQRNLKSCIYAFFSCAGLDEVGSCHHRHQARLVDIGHSATLPNREDCFHVDVSTCFFAGLDICVKSLPVS